MQKSRGKKKSDMNLLFTQASSLTQRDLRKKKRLRNRAIGFTLIALQVIISIVFLWMLFGLDVVPTRYMAMLVTVMVLITAYNISSQFTKAHAFGKLLAFFLIIILCTGSVYVYKTGSMLGEISGSDTQSNYCSIIVLNTDPADKLSDAKNYTFGYNESVDKITSENAISQINTQLDTTLKTSTSKDWDSLVNALYNGNVKAIILNESNRPDVVAKFKNFREKTKVIDTIKVDTKVDKNSVKNVITKPFTIYIGGTNEYGTVSTSGLNDVNIIATFNPENRQILLVTTPRDYFIDIYTLSEKGIKKDKLTHAGNFGMAGSLTTLANLYGIDIDYYLRVNFTGAMGIVDALGGIDINSEVAFTTHHDTSIIKYNFTVGLNANCNGDKTLAFCRERMNFPNGDNQRGRNQTFAIQGILAKAKSPAILTNYASVMDAVSGFFMTSMPKETITALLKDTLNDPKAWNVQMYSVSGFEGPNVRSNLYPNDPLLSEMSVTYPDYDSINTAKELMSKVRNGDVFNVEEYLSSQTKSPTLGQ